MEQFPEQGVWANISVGAGARAEVPFLVMDSNKTLWIMFGSRTSRAGTYLMTVWNYDPKLDLYRWVAGTSNSTTYLRNPGELRVPSKDNYPGAVEYVQAAIDHNDNIWFTTTVDCCELWMFNTTSYLFTRMNGLYNETSKPSYGSTPGQPGDDVFPGYIEGACFVTDSQNDLWLVSGWNTNSIATSSVWHFNATSLRWTFKYGNMTQSVATEWGANPVFGGRWSPGCDIDENDQVWLFGGWSKGIDYSDMWSYDTRTNHWQLEYGSEVNFNNNATVVSDDYHANNMPNAREGPALVDRRDGTLILVGGGGIANVDDWGGLNDVWLFNKTLKQWKLIYGDPFMIEHPGNFTHYRTPGSVMPGRFYQGVTSGLNLDGDVFFVGGEINNNVLGRKDIWLVPHDQCSSITNKCDTHAQCSEEMIGYSCQCRDGFTGNGFTCTAVAPPQSPSTSSGVKLLSSLALWLIVIQNW